MAEKIPRLLAGVDIRKFKLDAMDGFLLSRIDGKSGIKDLARDTGLPDFSVERSLVKLEKLAVIEMIDPNAPPPPPPGEKRSAIAQFSVALAEPKYDPKELEEADVDLTADQRKRILDLFYRLEDLDHYTLLGITRDADKKAVKRAYFELAAHMHPDRYFGKKLGTFKPKMEVLFTRITEAHDTLTVTELRTEYDAYIDEVATTRGMEAMLERAMEESARAAQAEAAAAVAAAPSPSNRPSSPNNTVPPSAGLSPEELQSRRETLAKRLLGGNSLRPSAQSNPNPSDRPSPLRYSNPADAMDALKRRYHERIDNATLAQAKKYIDAAEEALSRKDIVQAASMFSIAVKFAPEDAALAMRYQEIKNDADALLCDSYQKQAIYEERQHHWQEAARSWQKVARIKPDDPRAQDRAAHAILKSEGDLHEAAEHAKAAVSASPEEVAYHVTLAEIYVKAGLSASAKRAAEAGLQVEPKNSTLLQIVKRASK
jgi:curved DNA-binding protein CbpA